MADISSDRAGKKAGESVRDKSAAEEDPPDANQS